MDIQDFYSKYIDMTTSIMAGEEIRALCPCHKDDNPSLSINKHTGLYHCFSPKCSLYGGGNMVKFLSIVEDIPYEDAKKTIEKEFPPSVDPMSKPRKTRVLKDFPITQEDVDQRKAALYDHPERVTELSKITLWTLETMKRFEVGYDAREQRYWIPIKEHGRLVNIRKYSPVLPNKVIQVTGFSEPRIFPYDNLQEQTIYLMEGEKDCILANQHGLTAITFTAGAGTFNSAWKQYFSGKDVVLCYDIDDAGREGAQKVIDNLSAVVKSIKNVMLPITDPPNGDYTDYFLQGATPQQFLALVDATPDANPTPSGPVEIPDTIFDVDLDKVAEERMFYKRTRCKVRVISKNSSPSIMPCKLGVECNRDNGKMCYTCNLGDAPGHKEHIDITETTPALLQLIECTTKERKSIIRDIFGISACRKFQVKETEHQSITRCSVIPSLDTVSLNQATYNQKYVEREVFVLGATVDANTDYEILSIAMPDPKNQSLVHLVYNTKPADSSIEQFRLTPELKKELEIFQCSSGTN